MPNSTTRSASATRFYGGPEHNFISGMVYHRIWFRKEHYGWTIGGGFLHNSGRYLALLPTGAGILTHYPGDKFDAWDASTTLQYMPNEYVTFGFELVRRHASVPYFAGRGGVTSPNGYNPPLGDPTGFKADLVQDETRFIFSLIFRM